MTLPRWTTRFMILVIVPLSAASWWGWVTWPRRTANEFGAWLSGRTLTTEEIGALPISSNIKNIGRVAFHHPATEVRVIPRHRSIAETCLGIQMFRVEFEIANTPIGTSLRLLDMVVRRGSVTSIDIPLAFSKKDLLGGWSERPGRRTLQVREQYSRAGIYLPRVIFIRPGDQVHFPIEVPRIKPLTTSVDVLFSGLPAGVNVQSTHGDENVGFNHIRISYEIGRGLIATASKDTIPGGYEIQATAQIDGEDHECRLLVDVAWVRSARPFEILTHENRASSTALVCPCPPSVP